ncbi:MAG: mntH [Propionibacteriaceae bacterium]|nr:mntH [Propionibacteriaceae bacterium]
MTLLQREALLQRTRLLGPAFVAAVAYVDPGVGATLMAGLVQYLSAKVGWLTGETLPALVARRNSTLPRICYWIQAELVAMATDLAEIVGGAVALNLLFGLPLVTGALITTVVSTGLLFLQNTRSQQTFERVITGMLAVVTVGFLAGLVASPPDPGQALAGLVPALSGTESAVLAVGMLGATVMPHAIYLHSALIRDRHGRADPDCAVPMLKTIRLDVGLAMLVAGTVNVGMLLLAASTLSGLNVEGLQAAHSALGAELGPLIAGLFALALLASGLASTSVGGYAGAVIMDGLLHRRIPILWRRVLIVRDSLCAGSAGSNRLRSGSDAPGAHQTSHHWCHLVGDRHCHGTEFDLDRAYRSGSVTEARISCQLRPPGERSESSRLSWQPPGPGPRRRCQQRCVIPVLAHRRVVAQQVALDEAVVALHGYRFSVGPGERCRSFSNPSAMTVRIGGYKARSARSELKASRAIKLATGSATRCRARSAWCGAAAG